MMSGFALVRMSTEFPIVADGRSAKEADGPPRRPSGRQLGAATSTPHVDIIPRHL
jgi:hypothetical protein